MASAPSAEPSATRVVYWGGTVQPTPTMFLLLPGATLPPALGQLAKLPTAIDRWQAESRNSGGSGFPWEIVVFGVGAVALLGTALMLARRQADD